MKLTDISVLKLDPNDTEFFDLTAATFEMVSNIEVFGYSVKRGDVMRIDIVCNNIYGTTDHVDFLLDINNIINPLNVRENDIIIYVDEKLINSFRPEPEILEEVKKAFLNLSKKKRSDSNRKKKENERPSLPPTINTAKVDPVKTQNGNVIIGDGLFNQ